MLLSIITAVKNSRNTITDCIDSISLQTYNDIEHIIIDGGSTDGTLEVIQSAVVGKNVKLISEPDKGIYDAINKGISLASGEIIGLLHADDVYFDENVLAKVVEAFQTSGTDSVYGDLIYVDKNDLNKIFRNWKAGYFTVESLKKGWMPPHPAFFVKKKIYERYGLFDINLKIAADYDLILRFLGKANISTYYLPQTLVKMRWGGKSNKNLANIFHKSSEDYLSLKKNGFAFPFLTLIRKNMSKVPQLFTK
ncbi:MAG: glycosyltransferase [Ignavibacteriaceae bacterium]|nr:glycosyltransferase [Ignavibacteriaceae bacterium]